MSRLVRAWYADTPWVNLLRPLALLFRGLVALRRWLYRGGFVKVWRAPVPVVVVGNITVGGVGKTPLVAALTQWFVSQGYRPGIVSRGYAAAAPHYPFVVDSSADVDLAGDEPLMLAKRTGCPVVIDPDRVAAAKHLVTYFSCDLIISDDGLQHYRLGRDIEVAVVDASRGLGNNLCLPAGPLREPVQRLREVDFVIINGEGQPGSALAKRLEEGYSATATSKGEAAMVTRMQLQPQAVVNILTDQEQALDQALFDNEIHAIAGIGNPARFFTTLAGLGYQATAHEFPDHYRYRTEDIRFDDNKPIIMTEKDAVKCAAIADEKCWYLKVAAQLDSDFLELLGERIARLNANPTKQQEYSNGR